MVTEPVNVWKYKGKEITYIEDFGDIVPFGFIYMITHISGKKYIGKKQLYHSSKQKLGKKEAAALPKGLGRPQKFKQVIKQSDWQKYYGSNEIIKQLIKEGKQDEFEREIIKLVYNKKMLSYFETKLQFVYEVLEYPDEWYNDHIEGKYFSVDFIE